MIADQPKEAWPPMTILHPLASVCSLTGPDGETAEFPDAYLEGTEERKD